MDDANENVPKNESPKVNASEGENNCGSDSNKNDGEGIGNPTEPTVTPEEKLAADEPSASEDHHEDQQPSQAHPKPAIATINALSEQAASQSMPLTLPNQPNCIENVVAEVAALKEELRSLSSKVDEQSRALIQSTEVTSAFKNANYATKAELDRSFSELKGVFDKLADENSILRRLVEKKMDASKLMRIREEQERLSSKIDDILDEIGFGEEMNVAKIPPNILEIVYQTTLDDAITELWKNLGPYEAEHVITTTMEEVRLNTSGSELFKFDGRRLRARELAKTIEQKLISAKQVQITYNEILDKLLERIPGHKAKNFNAMIKIKSQEYAVDKVSTLLERVGALEKRADEYSNMLAAITTSIPVQTKHVLEKVKAELDAGISEKASQGDISDLRKMLERIEIEQANIRSELSEIREALSRNAGEIAGTSERAEKSGSSEYSEKPEMSKPEIAVPEERPESGGARTNGPNEESKAKDEYASKNPHEPQPVGNTEDENKKDVLLGFSGTIVIGDEPEPAKVEDKAPPAIEPGSDEETVYNALQKKGSSIPKILKKLSYDMTEDAVERLLTTLEERGLVRSMKKGKHKLYFKSSEYETTEAEEEES